jgi:hypothetical protein
VAALSKKCFRLRIDGKISKSAAEESHLARVLARARKQGFRLRGEHHDDLLVRAAQPFARWRFF